MLRPAQAFGFVSAVERCDGPVRPHQPRLRRLVARPSPRRRDCQGAFAFDHHIARVRGSWCDERQTACGRRRYACTSQLRLFELYKPRAAKPHPPVAMRRQLRRARPEWPIVQQRLSLGGAQCGGEAVSRARAAKPANPSASPSTASLRRASAVLSSMISRASVLTSVRVFDPLRRRFRQFRRFLADRSGLVNHEMPRSQSIAILRHFGCPAQPGKLTCLGLRRIPDRQADGFVRPTCSIRTPDANAPPSSMPSSIFATSGYICTASTLTERPDHVGRQGSQIKRTSRSGLTWRVLSSRCNLHQALSTFPRLTPSTGRLVPTCRRIVGPN
jgi:hypothetical protein